jgi:hypothetical protein
MSGPVLTTAQAAEYVGLKPQTMRKLKCIGTGPKAYKQGRLTVYYPGDLHARRRTGYPVDRGLPGRDRRAPSPSRRDYRGLTPESRNPPAGTRRASQERSHTGGSGTDSRP